MTCRLFLLVLLLMAGRRAAAQPAGPDVIFRTDGAEIAGRVVVLTPVCLRYLPPASADTLRLAVADVFMVRYANGTRELLHPVPPAAAPGPAAAPDLLPGLGTAARQALGRRDAGRNYRNNGPFWGALGAGLGTGPLLGLMAPAIMAPYPVADVRLGAPRPALLAEPAYGPAYRQQAQHLKRRRTWAGYGVGVGLLVLLLASGQ